MAPKIIYLFLVAFCLSFPHSTQATISQFKLYTPGSSSPETISAGNLGNRFNSSQKLTFIIHGYLQSGKTRWIPRMRTELMKREKMNIVVVDWSKKSVAMYHVAAKNTHVVGVEIAALIQQLHRRYNYTLAKIHVIGHSLGAHVAGFAGLKVYSLERKRLGRITGLDPARPLFDHSNTFAILDLHDAHFVDIIHTNAGVLGLERPSGHVDFYPNGGKEQPGCTKKGTLLLSKLLKVFKFSKNLPKDICGHMKAIKFFTASINSNQCSREAIPCANWETFKQGKCNQCNSSTCVEMGYNADQHQRSSVSKSSRKFYLKTLNSYPYCSPLFSYHVTLENVKVKAGSFFARNEIIIQLHGENGDSFPVSLSNVKSGTVSHVIISKKKLHPLQDISISYKGGSKKSATMYLGEITIVGPHSKYTAVFNTRLSSRILKLFFFIDILDFKTYKRPLLKISM